MKLAPSLSQRELEHQKRFFSHFVVLIDIEYFDRAHKYLNKLSIEEKVNIFQKLSKSGKGSYVPRYLNESCLAEERIEICQKLTKTGYSNCIA